MDPNADANATPVSTGADISSIPEGQFQNSSADTVNTVHDEPVKGNDDANTGDTGADTTNTDATNGDKAKPYHQDPDWQRMMKERDDARLEAATTKARLDEREKIATSKAEDKPADLPFKDISKMSKEEILEWFEDDPVGYEANRLLQFEYETEQRRAAKESESRRTSTVRETYEKYEKENADFRAMWDSKEILNHMEAQAKLGRNIDAIAAHKELTGEKNVEARIAKAVKEAEEKVIKNFQAKRNATVLSGGNAPPVPNGDDKRLSNTKQHGGTTTVLAERLAEMRRQAVGG